MKRRNPGFGYQRIAQQIAHTFGVEINTAAVRRVLAKHVASGAPDPTGRSWLTFFAHAKDSLWSVDIFRCESILHRSHWVLVVIDVFTRRIIGFAIGGEFIDGATVCRMFNQAIAGQTPPRPIGADVASLHRETDRDHSA